MSVTPGSFSTTGPGTWQRTPRRFDTQAAAGKGYQLKRCLAPASTARFRPGRWATGRCRMTSRSAAPGAAEPPALSAAPFEVWVASPARAAPWVPARAPGCRGPPGRHGPPACWPLAPWAGASGSPPSLTRTATCCRAGKFPTARSATRSTSGTSPHVSTRPPLSPHTRHRRLLRRHLLRRLRRDHAQPSHHQPSPRELTRNCRRWAPSSSFAVTQLRRRT